MSHFYARILDLIDRHRAAFLASLTIFLIGLFAGISFYSGRDTNTALATEVATTPSFLGSFFAFFLPNTIIFLIFFMLGIRKFSALLLTPIVLLYRGFTFGKELLPRAGCDFLLSLPVVIVFSAFCILAGTVCFSSASYRKYIDPGSYKSFFLLIVMIDFIVCLIYAIIKSIM